MKYRKLIFLIILFASVPLYALDLIATRVQIRAQIGDISTDTVKQRWSDSLLNDRINIVQEILPYIPAVFTAGRLLLRLRVRRNIICQVIV